MFKKFALVVLIMSLLVLPAMAQYDESLRGKIYTYQVINSSTVAYQDTVIPVTSIVAKRDRILGWSIMKQDLTKNSEFVCAVYDQITTPISSVSGECIGESESDGTSSGDFWLVYAREIDNGLLVHQGPNTVVTIYFSR